jgi:hypothetical protein
MISYTDIKKDDDRWLTAALKKSPDRGESKNEYFMGTDFTTMYGWPRIDQDTHKLLGEETFGSKMLQIDSRFLLIE